MASHASVAIAKNTSGRIAETRIWILERMIKSHLNRLYEFFLTTLFMLFRETTLRNVTVDGEEKI